LNEPAKLSCDLCGREVQVKYPFTKHTTDLKWVPWVCHYCIAEEYGVEIPASLVEKLPGAHYIRVAKCDKRPIDPDWPNNPMKPDDPRLVEHLRRGGNYGVCGGNGLVILDADSREVFEAVDKHLPKTFTVQSPGSLGRHYYYHCDLERPIRLYDKGKVNLGDVQGKGKMVVGPGCYSEDTRVLTRDGFKHFYELTYEDELATLNPETEKIEYHKPTKIFVFDYKGPMVHFRSRSIDLLVTPDHKVYVASHNRANFRLVEASKLVGKTVWFKRTASWDGENPQFLELPKPEATNARREKTYREALSLRRQGYKLREIAERVGVSANTLCDWFYHGDKPNPYGRCVTTLKLLEKVPTDKWVKFMGWWISEGSLNFGQNSNYVVQITQKDPQNRREIIDLVNEIGFTHRVDKSRMNISFNSRQVAEYLRKFWKPKRIPPELKRLSPKMLEILLTTLARGDGYLENGRLRRFYTSSSALVNDVVEIAVKCGYAVTVRFRKRIKTLPNGKTVESEGFVVNFSRPKKGNKASSKLVSYSGKVYCVEVPNHIIFVERNGRTCWSGNSWHPCGRQYRILWDVPIAEVKVEQLREALAEWIVPEEHVENLHVRAKREADLFNIGILDVLTVGLGKLRRSGEEYYGPHPIHGSTTGRNFWVNPRKNVFYCFRHNVGGGPLTWLAIEEGIIRCEEAGPGALKGEVFKRVLEALERRGFKVPSYLKKAGSVEWNGQDLIIDGAKFKVPTTLEVRL